MVISAIQVYEVYRVICRDMSEAEAIDAVVAMRRADVVPLDESMATEAADVSLRHRLAMADAIVYATAQRFEATLVTKDADFDGLRDVIVVT